MNYLLITLTIIYCLICTTNGTSSGDSISLCDVDDPTYGCELENFPNGNRKQCTLKNERIMYWVAKAEPSNDYTLTLGQNGGRMVQSYHPGDLIRVNIYSLKHGEAFQGIMLYALNEEGERVGSWEFNDENPAHFQHAPICEKTVIHASGIKKPYHVSLGFRAPDQLIGNIYFKCLLKIQGANTGFFWWPKGTIENRVYLTQSEEPNNTPNWVKSDLGQSCAEKCLTTNQFCDQDAIRSINSKNAMSSILKNNLCKLPLLSSCDGLGPKSSTDNLCYYDDTQQNCNRQGRNYQQTTCDTKSNNERLGRRWCTCYGQVSTDSVPPTNPTNGLPVINPTVINPTVINPTVINPTVINPTVINPTVINPTVINPTVPKAGDSNVPKETVATKLAGNEAQSCKTNDDCESNVCLYGGKCQPADEEEGENSGSSLSAIFGLVVSMIFSFTPKYFGKSILIVGLFCYLSGNVEGHNWIHSPGRGAGSGSLTQPCPPKVSASPHVQVRHGQDFQIEWMCGHDLSVGYLLLSHESGYPEFTKHGYGYLKRYEADIDLNTNMLTADNNKYKRRHRGSFIEDKMGAQVMTDNPLYYPPTDGFVQNDEPMYWYQDHIYVDMKDFRTRQRNPKFPHILEMSRYTNPHNLPGEWDVALFNLENGLEAGRYIMHYVWHGYRDCIEIDLLNRATDVPFVYGEGALDSTYTMIPHCYFTGSIATEASQICSDPGLDAYIALKRCDGKGIGECRGIQINPFLPPSTINPAFQEFAEDMIPWFKAPRTQPHLSCNHSLPKLQSLPEYLQKQTYIAVATTAREATTTHWYYDLTEDPTDPMFYSSCIYRSNVRKFIGYTSASEEAVEAQPEQWRFGESCISCENKARNEFEFIPKYELADTCINCDEEPHDYKPIQAVLIGEGTGISVGRGNSCPGGCIKHLEHLDSRSAWFSSRECAMYASMDEECTDFVSYRSGEKPDGGTPWSCFCWKNTDCCMLDSNENELHYTSTYTQEHMNSINVGKVATSDEPDPTCANGEKKGTECCAIDSKSNKLLLCPIAADNQNLARSCNEVSAPCFIQV